MSLGPLMVDVAGTELTAEDVAVLSHPLVGSVLLFTRNYRNPGQVAALTAAAWVPVPGVSVPARPA